MAWITFGVAPPARAASSHPSHRLWPARGRSGAAYPEKELFAASGHVSSVSDAMRPAGRVDAATPQARPGAHRTWGTAIRPVSRHGGVWPVGRARGRIARSARSRGHLRAGPVLSA